jgi:hypothetical protein
MDHCARQGVEAHATEEGRGRSTQGTGGDAMAFHVLIVALMALVSRMILALFVPARFV